MFLNILKIIINCSVTLLPFRLRRIILAKCYGYDIHPQTKIGLSYIFPKHLVMEKGAAIGHLNVAVNLDKMVLGKNSIISRGNWITGFPTGTKSRHFANDTDRKSELIIGKESAITKNHHIDCTNSVHIGDFTTIAGYNSIFLTHSIDIYENRQSSRPISVGNYCFVSTNAKVMGGCRLPDNSALAAGAVLTKVYTDEWTIYGGIPARPIKKIPATAKYFHREKGFVY